MRNRFIYVLFFLSYLKLYQVSGARILCVFPVPAISHQSVFRVYTQELARQGHELVIVTPEPIYVKERPPKNIIEIDIKSVSYGAMVKMTENINKKGLAKRGVIMDVETYTDDVILDLYTTMCAEQLNHPEIKKLIKDKNQHFDLLVFEAITYYPLILSHIFKAPVITFSSFYGTAENYETIGAVSRHPIIHPQCHRNNFGDLTLWEKIKELYWEWKLMRFYGKVKDIDDEMLKINFGSDAPTIDELRNNVDMLFVNSHPIFDNNRPVPPNVVYLGALHMSPVKDIPKDLKAVLDSSQGGVIYVSLGSIVRPSNMDEDLLSHFLNAFEALPYNILWKFDGDSLKKKPKNVIIQKWFPQRDLLNHPNIKAFVTQGGLQSTDESIDAAVPMVGIPFVGDQWYNVHKYTDLGIGVKLDPYTLTSNALVKAVTEVIENKRYGENILKLRSVIRNQPQTPLQRAVWWTEYVLKHDARHLRTPAANMAWSEYLMLDVFLPLIAILIVSILIILAIILYVIKLCFKSWNVKLKRH